MLAISETWGSLMPTLFVIPSSCEGSKHVRATLGSHFMRGDVILDDKVPCEEYPPMTPWARTLRHMHARRRSGPDGTRWYFKCDDDSYINARTLRLLLGQLSTLDPAKPYYFGAPGLGRKGEEVLLGTNGKPYAEGGPCAVISAGAMELLIPVVDACMRKPVAAPHSDSLLGVCFMDMGVEFGLPGYTLPQLKAIFRPIYRHKSDELPALTAKGEFATSTVGRVVPPYARAAVSMHTVKDRPLMHTVHAQVLYGARPHVVGCPYPYPCMHNPNFFEPSATTLAPAAGGSAAPANTPPPECPTVHFDNYTPPKSLRALVDMVYYLGFSGNASSSEMRMLEKRLGTDKIRVMRPPADAAGSEPTTLPAKRHAVFVAAFTDAIRRDFGTVLVLEPGVALHPNLTAHLGALFACARCVCQVQRGSGCVPGVLQLGAAVADGAERERMAAEVALHQQPCANTPRNVAGAYGVIYNGLVLPSLVANFEHSKRWRPPYKLLGTDGYVVRTAMPSLVFSSRVGRTAARALFK